MWRNWKDQLTSYNNQSITYDAIGNPSSYLGASLTWNERKLLSYSKNNATISYSYNADGIRRSKESANEKIIYDYAGGTLVHQYHETSGIDIFYSYDSKGHLMMIETLQNQVLNKYYVAVKSIGNVERIYNSSKALVA